ASVKSFYETKCPKCGGKARRETDVSDTFLDSAWYYLRYPSTRSARSGQVPWDPEVTKKWLPVNLYTGGAEHSVLHLLYVRFLALALHDLKLLEFGKSDAPEGEPFPKFRAHGLLIKEGAKMSKSKGNVVNPDEYIRRFGADTLRMYLMFLAPFEQGGDFRDSGILGIERFLQRTWTLVISFVERKGKESNLQRKYIDLVINGTIKKVTEDIENLKYNTAISALMILLNAMEENKNSLSAVHCSLFLKLLAPFAPHIAEELWEKSGNEKSIHKEKWPEYSPKLIREENFELVIQINGKVRATVTVEKGLSQKEAEKLALGTGKIAGFLGAKKPKKVVFVPDRLINFVV
ncbi:MAG: class I tRNA ligase family protein, partial [Candidatus Jorgensenbacteria bacterium]